ncbi:DUF4124 domain-containing protein [Gilvimarinus agarilyticus]|uniref:DUF4124 domain-containing protein n=1 Tax=unclassified Gilvimarinus TaxID=2642066 RepID=UPI001C089D71|nr:MULTISPECIES: DUF4124 domain-containing protein [unclassified Gilvimarinus]MBU2884538.1 DUF4124 domain-containing protein [Gilvimarinus agarilyticus]MDO6569666.1 DUF4124 domain-containing protein [Gilvimarinus sp. 2_MG-2023]MDO6748007.1 DUF4124 domain-containing protein [Gilvimarinus sp. 1_MG-2023]
MRVGWKLALMVMISVPAVCGAELYRWTDSDGKVHYSDRNPGDVQAESIEKTLKPVNVDESHQETKKLNRVFPEGENEELTSETAQKRRQEQQAQQEQDQRCAQAKEYLRKLKGPVYFVDEEGNEYDISERERQEREKELEQSIAEHC